MGTNDLLCKDMLSKLKEAFSLKTFSSKSYQSSLICNSTIIRLDASLVKGVVTTSDEAFSCSNFTSKNPEHVARMSEKFRNKCDRNSDKKESDCSSSSKMESSKSERNKEPRISAYEKLKLKMPLKYSRQTKSYNLLNHVETKVQQDRSDFKSFRCDVCMKYYSSQRSVRRHRVLHSLERHPCKTCGKIFRTKETLKRHSKVVHEVKVFSREGGLKKNHSARSG